MQNKIKVFGLTLGMMAMSFAFFVGNQPAVQAGVPVGESCYMHMASCNGGVMSLDNCRTRTTAETCRGVTCSTCTI